METAKLGKTDIEVTALGIGTWAWGDRLFWNYGKEYGEEQVKTAFEAALDAGITFFDTAEVYGPGISESLLGQFMQQHRDQPIDIATKYGPLPWRFTKEAVAEAVTASLKRLQLPIVTLYQVHWPFTFFMSQETLMDALADEVQQGRIKSVGVSNYSADQMREAHELLAKRDIPLAVNQVQYSLLHRNIERNDVLKTAQNLGITILAYSPLAQGLLTGKFRPEKYSKPEGPRQFKPQFKAENLQKMSPLLQKLDELSEKYQKTPAQVSLNWLMCQGNVIPIPGAKNADQARQNAGALGWRLTAEDVQELGKLSD
ncbi:aldo/keto reductase [Spirulina sp. CS-785/01]|uniref:aldo/keto reductase n=1 Tax=Spirulina sp. CS-785/01 TaxID=3021716 RepID=UPI00232F4EF1|nr:aldo/keto reductase [Spirulina sp. CS-785/01]MDB9314737.1 aldo/keto reductase [Spirulina sp. CS-785/01]